MTDLRLPPDALDRLARRVGEEQSKAGASAGATTFGWPPPGAEDAPKQIGRFRITGYLGRGGMGVVWQGEDPEKKIPVAVKVLTASGPGEAELRKRFAREGEVARKLDHPGIVRVLETGEDAGKPFIAMELVDGPALDDASVSWDLRKRVEALEKVARAVAHAHALGVAHRDLKPANIRLGADGAPRVMDFGLAAVESDATRLTLTGSVMGTPAWMAPEQVRGEPSGAPADVYALGVMLYQALAGGLPFEGGNAPQVYQRILGEDPLWPRKRAPGVPAPLEAVCLRAMEKEPTKRYPTAAEIADELAAWLAGRPVRARLPGPAARLARRARRNPLAALGLAAAAASLLVAGAVVTLQSLQHARERRARDIYRDAQPLASQALMALLAGDQPAGERLFSQFLLRVGEARRTDPGFRGGWFEAAEFNRVLGDESSAWAALSEGFRHDPEAAAGRIERGILTAARYRRGFRAASAALERAEQEAAQREGRAPKRITAEEVEAAEPSLATLRARAQADLNAGVERIGGGDPPSVKLARAELAAARRDFAEAETVLGGLEWAEAKVLRGAIAEARDYLEEAEAWYAKAIATREGAWEAWEARASVRQRMAEREWDPGTEKGESKMAEAVADWTRLADAGRRGALAGRASARCALGRMRVYRGADPREALEGAAADAETAGDDASREWLGRSLKWLGDWLGAHEGDADPVYARASAALEAAILLRPRDPGLQIELGATLRMRAFNLAVRRGDAAPYYEAALRAYDAALALSPSLWHAHANKGHIHGEMGLWKEAVADFEAAERVLGKEYEPLRKDLEKARERAGGLR